MSAKRCAIVLIHGLWVTPLIWEPFYRFYGNLGYHVLAPPWPGLKGSIADMRRDPSGLCAIGLADVLDRYAKIIRSLSEPPIIIGHCYGGLIAQLLGDQGLGAVAVIIAPLPPRGLLVRSVFSRLTLLSLVIGFSEEHRTAAPTFTQFRRKFCNSLPESGARHIYNAQVIPASRRMVLQVALADFTSREATSVNCGSSRRPPLLVIGGGADLITSGSLCRAIHRKHRASSRLTEYKEFPGRSHLMIAEAGWQDVADYALTWSRAHAWT
jgi:pimeloyl-ACP methyl ester carboxylesterase